MTTLRHDLTAESGHVLPCILPADSTRPPCIPLQSGKYLHVRPSLTLPGRWATTWTYDEPRPVRPAYTVLSEEGAAFASDVYVIKACPPPLPAHSLPCSARLRGGKCTGEHPFNLVGGRDLTGL